MNRSLSWVASKLGLQCDGNPSVEITGWSIDSRTAKAGDLFIALRGPNHDGNLHVASALRNGAVAAIVDGDVEADSPLFQVSDSLAALQLLAQEARAEWSGDVVGVTGSAGKTTSKDMIAEMLSEQFRVTKTVGNLNNHVGLPLSLLRMNESAQIAVLEFGMNHAGEIRQLTGIAKPNVAVVTNVGWAHIENFESIDGIAAAKRELVESLDRIGTAVLNVDDPQVAKFPDAHQGPVVRYGFSADADVRATDMEYGLDGVRFRVADVDFQSQLTGRHNVSNLLAGIAVAGVYGLGPSSLVERVRTLRPSSMRGERLTVDDILIYNDCYNSNPEAARAMLDVLRDTPAKRRIAVLGEMLELGHWAEPLHRDVGSYAVACGVDVLVGIRGAAGQMLDAAQRSGLSADAAFFFENAEQAGEMIRSIARPGDAILFKGSRGVHVEQALAALLEGHPDEKSTQPVGSVKGAH